MAAVEVHAYGAANPLTDAASRSATRASAAAAAAAIDAAHADPLLGPVDPTGSEVIQFTSQAPGGEPPQQEPFEHTPGAIDQLIREGKRVYTPRRRGIPGTSGQIECLLNHPGDEDTCPTRTSSRARTPRATPSCNNKK